MSGDPLTRAEWVYLLPVDAVSDWWACVACGIERTDAEPTEERDGGCHHLDRCPNCGDDRTPEARTDHDDAARGDQ